MRLTKALHLPKVPIRWRLAVLIMILVGVVITVTSILANRTLSNRARYDLDEVIAEEAREFAVAASDLQSPARLRPFAEDYFWLHRYEEEDRIFVFYLADGTVLSLHADTEPHLLPLELPAPTPGVVSVSSLRSRGGDRYRIATISVIVQGQDVGTIYVAEPTGPVEAIVAKHARNILFAALGGLAIAGVGAYLIARTSLSPIRSVTRTAESISQKDLSRRIDYDGPDDEVGELATAFDAMIERLDHAFAEQGHLLADLSHQLRTPITVVRGHLDLLHRHQDLPRQDSRESLQTAVGELDRMNRLVGDLLLLARTGSVDFLKPAALALRPFLQEVIFKAQGLARRTWLLGPVPDCTLLADRDELTGAFLNLFQNAVNHTEPNDSIGLDARIENGWVFIRVWDTGHGIPSEDLGRIFDRFYRGTRTGPAGEGAGLGLTIVDAVVRAHAGTVQVESRLGEGAAFTVRLPVSGSVL